MTGFLGKFILLLLIVLPAIILLTNNDGFSTGLAFAEDATDDEPRASTGQDEVDDDDDEEETTIEDDTVEPSSTGDDKESESEDDKFAIKASPDASIHLLFTNPTDLKFIAGKPVQFLTGFQNNGDIEFIVDSIEASFRYPQDFSYHIQNFTNMKFTTIVKPNKQATFEYAFKPSDTFNSRPFGLTINMNYHNADGKEFLESVFNETIQIEEPQEGFDGEAFFLYIIMGAILVLLGLGAHHLFNHYGRKHLPKKSRNVVEMGTSKHNVDYDWIPKHAVETRNKSPKSSPKQSPRQRKTAKAE